MRKHESEIGKSQDREEPIVSWDMRYMPHTLKNREFLKV
jgi:hypothetical protein